MEDDKVASLSKVEEGSVRMMMGGERFLKGKQEKKRRELRTTFATKKLVSDPF